MQKRVVLSLACAGLCGLAGASQAQIPELYNPGFEIPFDPQFTTFASGFRHYQAGRTVRREVGDGLTPPAERRCGVASIRMPGAENVALGEFMGIHAEEFVPGVLPASRNWPQYTFDLAAGQPITAGFWFMIPANDPMFGQRAGFDLRFLRSGNNFSFYHRIEVLSIDPDPASALFPGCVRTTLPGGIPAIHTNGQWLRWSIVQNQQIDFPVADEPPTNPARASMLALRFGDLNSGGTMWVDDMFFYQGSQPCNADYNGVDGVSVQDIFDFLSDWSNGAPCADYNGQGGVSVQDIFDFLSDWSNPSC
jgi:hypothetical protein